MKSELPFNVLLLMLLGMLASAFSATGNIPLEPQPPELPWVVSKAIETEIEDADIEFAVDPATVNQEIVKGAITNNREETIYFGAEYRLQVQLFDDWWDIEVGEMSFIEILYELDPGDTLDMEFNLREYYGTPPDGKLISGPYRLIKQIYLNETGPDEEIDPVWVVAEFYNEG